MKRLFVALILASFIFLSNVPVVEAHHYIYFSEDPLNQKPDWPGVENGVFLKWATTNLPVKYYAEPNLSNDVSAVFLNWYVAVPLGWQGTINPAEADLFFYESQAPCGIASNDGCYDPYVFDYGYPHNASYTYKARIYIKPGLPYQRAQIAHELGKFYGLHNRFIDNSDSPTTNPSELSVMDIPLNDQLQGPSQVDKTRVRAFWGKHDTYQRNGYPNDPFEWPKGDLAITGITFQDYNPPFKYIAAFKWRDLAWTEQVQQMGAYWGYYDYPQNRIIWDNTPFYENAHMADIGLNFYLGAYRVDLGDKFMEDNIIPRDFKPAGYVMLCGKPYFPGVIDWGSFRCSNPLYIP